MMFRNITERVAALAAALVTASMAWGAPVTPEQALARLAGPDAPAKVKGNGNAMRLTHTFKTSDTPSAYVFAGADGFVVAPADDLAPAVLGYGKRFDPENIPANMQWWMDEYARQIEWLAANQQLAGEADAADHPEIEPMVKSTWGQDYPFNLRCPRLYDHLSVTGCLATALAQIVNYHQWPQEPGTGTRSYQWHGQTLSFDYGETIFDWSHIKDSYNYYEVTDADRDEVAKLMLACGIGVYMNYSPSASGALDIYVPRFITEHLGYDAGAAYKMRDYYSAKDWDNIVYGELAEGRPVLYCGQSSMGGHAFVCDGYSGNGYYHINWGWDGMSDGAFLLSALDPYAQGTGGSGNGTGFNSRQSIIMGIRPSTGQETPKYLPVYARAPMVWDDYYESFDFGLYGILNYSDRSFEAQCGIRLENEEGISYYAPDPEKTSFDGSSDGYLYGISSIKPTYPADLPAGLYKAYPIVRETSDDEWQPILIPFKDRRPPVVIKNEDGTFTYEDRMPDFAYLMIVGDLNDWWLGDLTYRLRAKQDDEGYTYYEGKLNLPAGASEFKFATALLTWEYGFGTPDSDNVLFAGNDFTAAEGTQKIKLENGGNNIMLPAQWPGGEMNVRVSLEDRTATFSWTSAGLSAIEEIDAPDSAATYYNLQGHPVATPADGVYIRVADGQASKVRIR